MSVTLEILKNGHLQETILLDDGRYTIGRDPSADIFLDSKTVSKNHATLAIDNGSFRVTDNGSSNGVYCKGEKISRITFKDTFQIELSPFTLRTPTEDEPVEDGKKALLPDSVGFFMNRNSKFIFCAVIVLAMLFTLLLVYVPLKNSAETIYQKERLKNGILLSKYLAEINRPFLKATEHSLIDTGPAREEDGVLYAFVIDGRGRILAPHEQQGDFFNWDGLARALKNARLQIDTGSRGENLIFSPVIHQDRVLGAAIIGFTANDTRGFQDAGMGGAAAFLLLVLLGLAIMAAYSLTGKLLSPLKFFREEVEVAIKEGRDHIGFQAPYEELDSLKRIINRLLLRTTSDANLSGPVKSTPDVKNDPEPGNGPVEINTAADDKGQDPGDADDHLSTLTGPWCLVDTESYTVVQLSETFIRDLNLEECRKGMHIIEAFDGDIISAVTQIMEAPDENTLELDVAGKKFRASGNRQKANNATVLIVFEEIG